MSVVDKLISTAVADVDLLTQRDAHGDTFSVSRPVDFVFQSTSETQARAVAGFLADYQYAETRIDIVNLEYRVIATINMPVEQRLLLSVSGFMQCIAALFSVDYDGWGAVIKTR